MHSFTCWLTGREQIFVYKLYTFFVEYNVLVLSLQHFNFVQNQIVLTTMKRMLNRMLRYADAIVKRGVDKLIDAIGHSPEPQSENAETPQLQKRMGNDTDCAPQTTGSTTNCGLTEQAISLIDELYAIRYNVLDRTSEVQRRDQADKGFCAREHQRALVLGVRALVALHGCTSKKQALFCSFKGSFP